jgi:glucose-1-phosphate cytidylyltransferase
MKAVILAGGHGTRISEETHLKPKPMIEIGGRPILWHILKFYSHFGVNDFIICAGYKSYIIKEYFINYALHSSDLTIDIVKNEVIFLKKNAETWKITIVDTGEDTMTGGRLKRINYLIENEKFFFMTYGDGLADLDINNLLKFHLDHKKLATITAVSPPGRFGALKINGSSVIGFKEKPESKDSLINGGFFILSPKVIDLIKDDQTIWEHEPIELLAKKNELQCFIHDKFWQPMDTLRDKVSLETLWNMNKAPWKVWK